MTNTRNTRLNALKRGIVSRDVLITSGESKENAAEFDRITDAFYQQFEPQGAIEQLLTEHLIAFHWRWNRVLRYENAAIASEVRDATSAAHFDESVRDPSAFYGVSLHAKQRDLAAELDAANDLIAALDAPDPLAQDTRLCGHALAIAEYLDVPIDALLGAEPPWRQRPSFEPALVEQAIAAACDRAGLSRSAFWALARPSVEAARYRVVTDVEHREEHLRCAQALATPPSAAQPSKIHRYEAHLSRQFYRALHELQRIQAARRPDTPEPQLCPTLEAPLPWQGRGRERGREGPGMRGEPLPAVLDSQSETANSEQSPLPDQEISAPAPRPSNARLWTRTIARRRRPPTPLPSQGRGRESGHEGRG